MMKKISALISTAIFIFILFPFSALSQEDPEMTEILRRGIGEVKKVVDYTATVHQIQRVRGKLMPEEVLLYKFRRPNSVYIRWVGEVKNGGEVLYSEGWNNNKLLAHTSGILGVLSLSVDPGSREGMKETRHPVSESSIIFMMDSLEGSLDHALSHPEDDIIIEDMGEGEVFGEKVKWIRLKFPYGEGYPYYAPLSIFGIDTDRYLPLYYKAIGNDGEMWEEYRFKDLKTNVGLSDSDFDPKNPKYGF
jgi:hypothetical protein